MRKQSRFALAACLLASVSSASLLARADDNTEYLVKAAFIYNFVKFIAWPDGKAINSQSKIDICVLGDSGMQQTGSVFKEASTPKLALNLVEEKTPRAVAGHCHVVFIATSEEAHINDILAALRGQPVLTVSDMDNFVEHGGMIGFVMKDNKVKIAVNTKAVTSANLRVDAQLLEIAAKVIDK